MSHKIGRLGILERENAALLNASLLNFADRVVTSFATAIKQRGLKCRFFISQNDGTLMDADFVREYPALTFASGPTNSLRGAGKLTGLGGGSLISDDGSDVGPRSVGHRLARDGLVFGGSTLTATDIVVAAGQANVGDASRVDGISTELVGGFDVGVAVIESFDGDVPPLRVDVKNEYLVARVNDQVVASVPDLITIVDYETSTPINAEQLRYGQRVTVFGVGCPAYYREARALAVVEPRCFGFDFDFTPIEDLCRLHRPHS